MTSDNMAKTGDLAIGDLPIGADIQVNVQQRQRVGKVWSTLLFAATVFGMIVLVVLLGNIIKDSFGLIAIQTEVSLQEITDGRPLTEVERPELLGIIRENLPPSQIRILENEQQLSERSNENLREVVLERVMKLEIVESWSLFEAIFNRGAIDAEVAEKYPRATVEWRAWLNLDFFGRVMSTTPALAGIRTALFGTLWVISITIVVSFPLGVGAAIYLEEYAATTKHKFLRRINAFIQTNINNLAGVPSIIYGMLGLSIFVRVFEPITSGTLFGAADPTTANGRTVISAGLTLALLILPIIIINSQEAIRAVPNSLRQASYGLGATKWQTIWTHVLPLAVPGMLTGTILAVSRAVGETAPLIVVGASTFIVSDPTGPFSKFTVLPIQIYNWTAQPSDQFRNIAAAAIIVLLCVLLSLNAIATLIRYRFSRSL